MAKTVGTVYEAVVIPTLRNLSVGMTTKSMQLAECIDFDEVINIFAEKIKDQDE